MIFASLFFHSLFFYMQKTHLKIIQLLLLYFIFSYTLNFLDGLALYATKPAEIFGKSVILFISKCIAFLLA